ncbi:MAG TPA: DUF523 domain-containing protein [Polyangiaceae bacterium]|jgi:uncharacterized protein YbbK (DUF523 family)|nr:MAG: hypothetical protein BWY17_02034 [Deltaproteobacteria bacterium ADurb.Bin207]HNS99534.1 DUF523 domain-containing protein [Polyangiaceae bacterium]HNZ24201.1 DUF523 domain-containing protein [Polyangiaceae bacterium]HOD22558.1 DUF523 domain-containing protein [Polyangiaceae bacterium]HOE49446.1 DUF523 domain-containing protein [Polyangiaceae bacterium]
MNVHDSIISNEKIIVVSACLLGACCRYDGRSQANDNVLSIIAHCGFLPVCPEQLGGLSTPRARHEIIGERVVSEYGDDATDAFERGAQQAFLLVTLSAARLAILKARSPSCGKGQVYDGTFTGRLCAGHGLFAKRLIEYGIRVLTEDEITQ